MIKINSLIGGLTALVLSPTLLADSSSYPYGGKFVMDAGAGLMVTKRAGCGAVKERPYYHELQLGQDNKFVEKIYINGIDVPDIELSGEWHEEKKRIYFSYDGAINDGASGQNSGWAPFLGDIETQLAKECGMAGISLINPIVDMKSYSLVINKAGTKAKLKMKFKSKSAGGYTKPRATSRSVTSNGTFKRNARE